MLTIFTHAKAFRGPTALIQRNVLRSWLLLHPDVQIILFGDAFGAQEVAWEFGLHYEESPKMTAAGAICLNYMFTTALRHARHDVLCYLPCDTFLFPGFCSAINRVEALYHEFVMIGRCHALHADGSMRCSDPTWQTRLKLRCERAAQDPAAEMSYLAFSRGCYQEAIPALPGNSQLSFNWLLQKAMAAEVAVVDATQMVVAVRQVDNAGHPAAETHTRAMELGGLSAEARLALRGDYKRLCRATSAPYLLTSKDVIPNRWVRLRRWHASLTRKRSQIFQDWGELRLDARTAGGLPGTEVQSGETDQP